MPKSFTFISAKLEDNQILMQKDPSYRANLEALPLVEKERLLGGNWKIKPAAGLYFKRGWFADKFVDEAPKCSRYVRFWDCAATDAKNANDPDYTVGVLMGELNGQYYVIDVQRFRKSPGAADEHMKQTAYSDGRDVMIREEEEPGSSGKRVIATHATSIFKGFNFLGIKSTGPKVTRAGPVSAACQNGNVYIVKAPWNNEFLSELEGFPERKHDDQVDALSGAFNALFHKPAKVPKFSPGFGLSGGMRI
jgi:predicted phage terminase large subunit-like protein